MQGLEKLLKNNNKTQILMLSILRIKRTSLENPKDNNLTICYHTKLLKSLKAVYCKLIFTNL